MKHSLPLLLLFFLPFLSPKAAAQQKINLGDISLDLSQYIFYGTPPLDKCDDLGNPLTGDAYPHTVAPLYATFTVHKQLNTNTYIIKMLTWPTNKKLFESKETHKQRLKKALEYNHFVPSTNMVSLEGKSTGDAISTVEQLSDKVFYLIATDDLSNFAYVYDPKPKYEFNYGTVSYLARLRPPLGNIPGYWATDLNLGLTAGIRRNLGKNVGISFLAGLSITKVNLDSLSTAGVVQSNSEKPAFTPSLNLLFSYQNFSIGFGMGMDWINENSTESNAWIYNKRTFFAIGFGINIFQSSGNGTGTASQDQNK